MKTIRAILEGDLSSVVESGELTVVADGFVGLEGPVWHPEGFLTFVDLEGNKLLRWDPVGGVKLVRHPNLAGNGCTLDDERRLVMCEGATRRIVRLEADGSWRTLADRWQGSRLNRPNDIVRRSDGSFYFTDPELFVPEEERDLKTSAIWRLAPSGDLEMVSTGLGFPNGLAFSPDESILYVSNSFQDEHCVHERQRKEVCTHRYLAAFDVGADGSLRNLRKVTDMSSAAHDLPDGLKVDRNGTVFCTGSGALWVLDPDGAVMGKILTPDLGRNCAFGDSDRKTLYITALTTVYSLRMRTPGLSGTGVVP